jgi:CIC family chloride channel protein
MPAQPPNGVDVETEERPVASRRLLMLAAGVGVLAGTLGIIFHLAVDRLLHWPGWVLDHPAWPLPLRWIALLLGILALIRASRWLVRRFAPETAGSGIPQIEGALEDRMPLRWRQVLPAKLLGGIAALGAGLVLGREGPTMHMGGAAGGMVAERGRCHPEDRRTLIAAGAAAGLAAAFNAPLAAVLFTIEETRRQVPYAFGRYHAIILAACLAALLTERVGGVGPDLALPEAADVPLAAYPLFPLLGAAIGAYGVLFNRGLIGALGAIGGWGERRRLLVETLLAAALAGGFMAMPALTGGGESLVARLAGAHTSTSLLFLLLLLRTAATLVCYAIGTPGGIFAPMLALATIGGLLFAHLVNLIAPAAGLPPVSFAIAAMGGLFAATVRAPLVGVVLVLELTGAYSLLLPALLTCLAASLTAQRLGGRPIYEQLLERLLPGARP